MENIKVQNWDYLNYYINMNEIPGELSREKF